MIRTATAYDIPVLKRIWDDSFHDSINYIDFIFDRLASPADALVYEENSRVVSMLLMQDTQFVFREESVDAVYILGAATSAKYQNRGMMTYLLEHAEGVARQSGKQLAVLVPGEQYLINYYKKRGYNPDFMVRSVTLRPGMLEQVPAADRPVVTDGVLPGEIAEIRERALQDIPHISWSGGQMAFVVEDSLVYGDHIAVYQGSAGGAYAFYSLQKRKLYVKECLGNTEAQMILIKELVRGSRARGAKVRLPVRDPLFGLEGEPVIYGMAKSLNVRSAIRDLDPYMNLMFD